MELSEKGFLFFVLAIVLPWGALTLYTFRRIKRFPMPDVQKNAWQFLVYSVPVIGLISWYAYEFRGSKQ